MPARRPVSETTAALALGASLALSAMSPALAVEKWRPTSPEDIAALAFCHAREAARLERTERRLRWSAEWTSEHQRTWSQRQAHEAVGAMLAEFADAETQSALVEAYGAAVVTRAPPPEGRSAEAWLHMNCAELTNRVQVALQRDGRLDRVALTPVDPDGGGWNAPGEPRLRMGEEP